MIHQLLCTHCTFASSRLESAQGEAGQKVLGYSVRASSIADSNLNLLREEFRTVERLLAYELPVDATATDRTSLDATTAPRRIFYVPSIGGRSVCGQIAYRQFDTAGRPGSYFAHLLVVPEKEATSAAFSGLECLRLAGLCHTDNTPGWHRADGEAFDLKPLASLDTWTGLAAQKWDAAVVAFLKEPDCSQAMPPGLALPDRWKAISIEDRKKLLASMLQATISRTNAPRVVLAVEPDVAAVLFYAVLRLIPKSVRQCIGFTTYEPDPFRSSSQLVATTFLRIDYRWAPQLPHTSALVYDTFAPPASAPLAGATSAGRYAQWAVDRLARGKLARIDRAIGCIDRSWTTAPTAEELDGATRIADSIDGLFDRKLATLPKDCSSVCRAFAADYCRTTVPGKLPAVEKWSGEDRARLLEHLPLFAGKLWEKLQTNPAVQRFVEQSRPTDEKDVARFLSQPDTSLPDPDALDTVLRFCRVKHRLPGADKDRKGPGPESMPRLWGILQPKEGASYAPPKLLVDALAVIAPSHTVTEPADTDSQIATAGSEPAKTFAILPPSFGLREIHGLVAALDNRLKKTLSERLQTHLRTLLDEAALRLTEDEMWELLRPSSFSHRDVSELYGGHDGAFDKRITTVVQQLARNPGRICRDARTVLDTLTVWQKCARTTPVHDAVKGWKHLLHWFEAHAERGILQLLRLSPKTEKKFPSEWEPSPVWPGDREPRLVISMEQTIQSISPQATSAADRSALLTNVLNELIAAGVIDAKQKPHLEALIRRICPEDTKKK